MSSNLAFGLGSGRCGTLSLARLFKWRHEPYRGRILWGTGAEPLIDELCRHNVPSVHSAFLGYVPYMLIVGRQPRFICLQRDRDQTVASFCRVTLNEVNPWDPTRPEESYQEIRNSLPKYPGLNKVDAVCRYYDEYYALAEHFQSVFSSYFKIFPTEMLSSEDGQRELAEWARVDGFVYTGPAHHHRSAA